MLVGSAPHHVVVAEVDGRALVEGLAPGAQAAALGHGKVEHDLNVASPVAGVGKDKDSVDNDVAELAGAGILVLLLGEFAEGSGGRVVLDDVSGSDNILEAVALGDLTALLAFATDDQNGAVGLGHLPHGSVTADELTWLDIALELAGQVATTLLFCLATAVGQENVRTVAKEKKC